MLYREAGQFKSTYAEDQRIFPIRQDRIAFWALMAVAFVVLPALGNQYWLGAIITPFLILALATLGLNILTGYAGQLSLGTAAFMAVGAFMAYNAQLRIPGMPILGSFLGAAFITLFPIFLNLVSGWISHATGFEISHAVISNLEAIIFGGLIIFFLIVEPHGFARLWQIAKEKLRLWPFPH